MNWLHYSRRAVEPYFIATLFVALMAIAALAFSITRRRIKRAKPAR